MSAAHVLSGHAWILDTGATKVGRDRARDASGEPGRCRPGGNRAWVEVEIAKLRPGNLAQFQIYDALRTICDEPKGHDFGHYLKIWTI
jgi:hypothetical protein